MSWNLTINVWVAFSLLYVELEGQEEELDPILGSTERGSWNFIPPLEQFELIIFL